MTNTLTSPSKNSADTPQPLGRVIEQVRGWVERCGAVWVEAQVIQREKFATVVELMRQVIKTINDAYDGKVRGMSPFNKVTSLTLKEAFDPITNVLDYSKVVFCDNEGSNVDNVAILSLITNFFCEKSYIK